MVSACGNRSSLTVWQNPSPGFVINRSSGTSFAVQTVPDDRNCGRYRADGGRRDVVCSADLTGPLLHREMTATLTEEISYQGHHSVGMTIQKIEFGVSGMHCGGCSGRLTTMLSELPGVGDVKVDHVAGTASLSVDYDQTTFDDITDCVLDAGFDVVPDSLKTL